MRRETRAAAEADWEGDKEAPTLPLELARHASSADLPGPLVTLHSTVGERDPRTRFCTRHPQSRALPSTTAAPTSALSLKIHQPPQSHSANRAMVPSQHPSAALSLPVPVKPLPIGHCTNNNLFNPVKSASRT